MGVAWHEYEIFELERSRVKQLQKDLRSLFYQNYRNPKELVQVLLRSLASQRQILAKGCATFICHAI